MEQWRITTERAHVSGASGIGRPPLAARLVAFLMLIVAVGLGILLVVPAIIVGALVVGLLTAVIALRRAASRALHHDGRRNVRVITRND